MFFDGADLINGALYAMEGDYVNAAISVACGIPAVGTVIAGAAKGTKAVKTAAKIADVCKAAGKAGNVVASVKSSYDTYMQARSEGKSAGEALAYTAGAMAVGIAVGKAAQWGAKKVTDFAKANLPKMASSVKESAGRFVNKVASAFQGGGSSGGGRKKINRGCAINPFYKGGSDSGIKAGKNFKDHFIRHKSLLENITGKKYFKYKTHGQEFLNDIGKIIDDGTVKYVGTGTLKKGQPAVNIYRRNGVTVVTKTDGEFVTIIESGKGLDLGIQMMD